MNNPTLLSSILSSLLYILPLLLCASILFEWEFNIQVGGVYLCVVSMHPVVWVGVLRNEFHPKAACISSFCLHVGVKSIWTVDSLKWSQLIRNSTYCSCDTVTQLSSQIWLLLVGIHFSCDCQCSRDQLRSCANNRFIALITTVGLVEYPLYMCCSFFILALLYISFWLCLFYYSWIRVHQL